MKRSFLLAAIGAVLCFVVSCQKTPSAELSVGSNEFSVDASGGSVNVSVSTNVDLTVRISAGWVTQAGSPSGGSGTYGFTVARNDTYDARTATITFSNGEAGVSETITVTQAQQDAIIPGGLEYTLFYEEQTFSLPVTANVDFTVSVSGGDWIKSIGTKGLTTRDSRFSIAENTGKKSREAVITITAASLKQSIKVEQLPTTHFPVTDGEWDNSIDLTDRITKEKAEIIRQLHQKGITDAGTIAKQLYDNVSGIIWAKASADGSSISFLQRDSVKGTIRLYDPVFHSSSQNANASALATRSTTSSDDKTVVIKKGGKALILAPHQNQFDKPLDDWYNILDQFFDVDSLKNSHATAEYFLGENLYDYDFILIDTHGTVFEDEYVILETGSPYDKSIRRTLKKKGYTGEYIITSEGEDGISYLCMTPDFLFGGSFDNAAVILSACHSAETRTMVHRFRSQGAAFVSGTSRTTSALALRVYVDNMLNCLKNGLSVDDAHNYSATSSLAREWTDDIIEKRRNTAGGGVSENDLPSLAIFDNIVSFYEPRIDYFFMDSHPSLNKPEGSSLSWTCPLNSFSTEWRTIHRFIYNPVIKDTKIDHYESYLGKSFPYSIVYKLYIDGDYYSKTSGKTITVKNLPSGEHKAFVVASVVGEDDEEIASFESNEVSFDVKAETVAVTGVTLDKSTLKLNVKETYQLVPTVKPSNATNKEVTWKSSNSAIATVSDDGTVTAVKAGTARITCTTRDGNKSAVCSVTVTNTTVSVTGVTLDKTTLKLNVKETYQLVPTVKPSNATNKEVTWKSSNSTVATVSDDGTVTAVKAGTARIICTTKDGNKTAQCNVTVTDDPGPGGDISVSKVTISPATVNLTVGDSHQFSVKVDPADATNQEVTWSSSDPTIASVDSKGLVTGKAEGKATITVTSKDGGLTSKATVTVSSKVIPVTGVTVSPSSMSMEIGESKSLTITVKPSDASNNTYTVTSDNTGVVVIDSDNSLVAKGAGTANVTVTTSDGGFTGKCVVTVSKPQMTIEASPTSLSFGKVNVGESASKTFSIKNTGKAEVKVSGISAPEGYSVDATTPLSIGVGQSKTITVTFTPTDGKAYNGTVTISSDAESQPKVTLTGTGVKQSSETFQAVDLGLSVKWSNMNLGATKPEDYGDYYAWGEIEPKESYDYDNYKWYKSYRINYYLTKYCSEKEIGYEGFTDGKFVLDLEDDAAHVKLGGGWRLPTKADIQELGKCTFEIATVNGVKGCKIIGPNGNSIFIPSAGYYEGSFLKEAGNECWCWTSLLYNSENANSLRIRVDTTTPDPQIKPWSRPYGLSIRPVKE